MEFIFSLQPFPRGQILDSSKLKEFADNIFEFDENGRKFSTRVENIVGKGEIACYEQFLLFPQCFQKTCTADTWKPGLVWERVKFTLKCRLPFVSICTCLKFCRLVMG